MNIACSYYLGTSTYWPTLYPKLCDIKVCFNRNHFNMCWLKRHLASKRRFLLYPFLCYTFREIFSRTLFITPNCCFLLLSSKIQTFNRDKYPFEIWLYTKRCFVKIIIRLFNIFHNMSKRVFKKYLKLCGEKLEHNPG